MKWKRRRSSQGSWFDIEAEKLRAVGLCGQWMRAPGAISSGWLCEASLGHAGSHRWSYHDPVIGEDRSVSFTTDDAVAANSRRASVAEMVAWEKKQVRDQVEGPV